MDVAGGDAARHRKLDAVRRPQRPTAGAALVTGSVAILATTLVAAAGMAGLAMRSMPARGRLVDDASARRRADRRRLLRWAGIARSPTRFRHSWTPGGAPLRNVHKLEPLIRLPLVLGLAHLLGRVPFPGERPAQGVAQRICPSRTRQTRCGRHRRAGGAGRQHVVGVDRPADPAGRVQRDTPLLARRRRLAHRAQRTAARHPAACWWCPGRRSPPRCGAPATTSRCRCSATARGACVIPSR